MTERLRHSTASPERTWMEKPKDICKEDNKRDPVIGWIQEVA